MHRPTLSILTSFVAAATVLGVFYSHQWYGPVGALNHYLYAIRQEDQATMDRLVVQPGPNLTLAQLSVYKRALKFNVVRTQQRGNLSRVQMECVFPPASDPVVVVMFWVLLETDGQWKVDWRQTFMANPRTLG
jgi:hypothetical protein